MGCQAWPFSVKIIEMVMKSLLDMLANALSLNTISTDNNSVESPLSAPSPPNWDVAFQLLVAENFKEKEGEKDKKDK